MNDTQDNNLSVHHGVNHGIWKTVQTGAAKLAVNDLVLQWILAHSK